MSVLLAPPPVTPVWRKLVAGVGVERYDGEHTPPLIFLAGSACGAWVWNDAVRHFAGKRRLYTVTLPGADSLPATPGFTTADAVNALQRLIEFDAIEKPVLVGHSLGGFIALRTLVAAPQAIGGVVTLDALAAFPEFTGFDREQRAEYAELLGGRFKEMTREEFAEGQKRASAEYITDPGLAEEVARATGRSDPFATGTYITEMLAGDLRDDLAGIDVPILALVQSPPEVPTAYPASIAAATPEQQAANMEAFVRPLLGAAPRARALAIPGARHYVHLDAPTRVYEEIEGFLAPQPMLLADGLKEC